MTLETKSTIIRPAEQQHEDVCTVQNPQANPRVPGRKAWIALMQLKVHTGTMTSVTPGANAGVQVHGCLSMFVCQCLSVNALFNRVTVLRCQRRGIRDERGRRAIEKIRSPRYASSLALPKPASTTLASRAPELTDNLCYQAQMLTRHNTFGPQLESRQQVTAPSCVALICVT